MGAREIFVSFIMRLFKMMIIFDSRKEGRNEELNFWLIKGERKSFCDLKYFRFLKRCFEVIEEASIF